MSLSITTVSDIINRSLRLLTVKVTGETLEADEAADALQQLNWMFDQWSLERLTVYQIKNELFPVTSGILSYTIGPSSDADWVTSRPAILDTTPAFVRQITSGIAIDYKCDYWPNDRYQAIVQKQVLTNYPSVWTFDHAFPIGTIKLYPKPNQNLLFGLSQPMQFCKFDSLSDCIGLPPGYDSAVAYGLAEHLAPEYGISAERMSIISAQARETKAKIKTANNEPMLLEIDRTLQQTMTPYNIYGGDVFVAACLSGAAIAAALGHVVMNLV
jgi:hypothetical protein